ncbi:MAG: TetR/AcrR family transcriptional regulator [Frankiaceae bacterium]|nr:TetR/AcrR family transcriptional regulator [Frankiaceae bacterium]MBV9870493.1 TetR/AcrR family transcriptional regulator [Frankiaceae bacterium]
MRTVEPEVRRRLIEAAAQLLADEGPSALSTRRLASSVGTSTMAVYTYFGGLPQLVQAVVDEGFTRLAAHLAAVPRTDDAAHDLLQLGWAYRQNAMENRELYAVMFGTASLGGYRRSESELEQGRYTFDVLVAATERAMADGQFRRDDAECVAAQLWSALHGFVMLELAGFFEAHQDAVEAVLLPLFVNLGVGLAAGASQRSAATP